MQRKAPNIDTCFYCGTEYHPMMIWSMHHQNIRYVCSYHWDAEREELRTQDVCENKARADGYEPWPERTPKRWKGGMKRPGVGGVGETAGAGTHRGVTFHTGYGEKDV